MGVQGSHSAARGFGGQRPPKGDCINASLDMGFNLYPVGLQNRDTFACCRAA